MRRRFSILIAACAALAFNAPEAKACTSQDCAYDPSYCYKLNGVRWCQIKYGYNPPFGHWTPITTYDHSSLGTAVEAAWQAWNYPANGPANSVYLHTDGQNHSHHDIDYWDTYSPDWWWGEASYPGGTSGGCINRGGAMIVFNTGQTWKADGVLRRWLAKHETGHAIGLGHVCNCPHVMNPCTECYNHVLSSCDGKGARALYH